MKTECTCPAGNLKANSFYLLATGSRAIVSLNPCDCHASGTTLMLLRGVPCCLEGYLMFILCLQTWLISKKYNDPKNYSLYKKQEKKNFCSCSAVAPSTVPKTSRKKELRLNKELSAFF